MSNTKGLYKFFWDCGRMGDVEGVFVSDRDSIKGIVGKEVYFGEILGKHSEVYGTVNKEDITLLTEETEAVKVVENYNLSSGYNPFDYLEESDEEE